MRVCNQTSNPVSIALGYRSSSGWQSEGWWVADPEGCAVVFQGQLSNRYFYLFAADDFAGGVWGGSVYMCTRDDAFTIFGVEDCLARGYERTGFFEIDTENRTDWTVQLTPENLFDPLAPATPDGEAPDMIEFLDDLPLDDLSDGTPGGEDVPTDETSP